MKDRICQNCLWWHQGPTMPRDIGECRRFPPNPYKDLGRVYPVTHGEDWCGEFCTTQVPPIEPMMLATGLI